VEGGAYCLYNVMSIFVLFLNAAMYSFILHFPKLVCILYEHSNAQICTTLYRTCFVFFMNAAMHSFVLHCPELVTEDVTRRLLPPLECALTMTVQ